MKTKTTKTAAAFNVDVSGKGRTVVMGAATAVALAAQSIYISERTQEEMVRTLSKGHGAYAGCGFNSVDVSPVVSQ